MTISPDDARFLEEMKYVNEWPPDGRAEWRPDVDQVRRLLRIVEGLSKELLLSRAIVDAQKKNADRDEEVVHRLGGEVKALKSKLSDAEARIGIGVADIKAALTIIDYDDNRREYKLLEDAIREMEAKR